MKNYQLEIPNLMQYSYFGDFPQRKPLAEITRGHAAKIDFIHLQKFVHMERVSFQSQQGLRFVLRVQPDQSGFELYVASNKNINFLKDKNSKDKGSEGIPLDLTPLLSFPLEEMELTKNTFPAGVYECEIFNCETQSALLSYLSLKKLKADNFYFRLTEVLHLYDVPANIHPVLSVRSKYGKLYSKNLLKALPEWDEFWTWQMRLQYLRHISNTNTNPRIKTIWDDSSQVSSDDHSQDFAFLPFGATPSQIQNFALNCFKNNRAVLMKERTGFYKILNWQGTTSFTTSPATSRTGNFRSVLFRSLSEIYTLTDSNFIRDLKSNDTGPDFLDKVRLIECVYPAKPTQKHGLLPDRIKVESLATKEIYEVAQLPLDIRKQFLRSNPPLGKGVYGWVEKESALSRSKPALICLTRNSEVST